MQDDPKSAHSGTPRRRRAWATSLAYILRVGQLLGLGGLVAGGLHWLARIGRPRVAESIFCVGALLLWVTSTLAQQWVKHKYPVTAWKAIQSADKRWNTPLVEERKAEVWVLCFFVVFGAMILWWLYS